MNTESNKGRRALAFGLVIILALGLSASLRAALNGDLGIIDKNLNNPTRIPFVDTVPFR